jgi:hypothetical protein
MVRVSAERAASGKMESRRGVCEMGGRKDGKENLSRGAASERRRSEEKPRLEDARRPTTAKEGVSESARSSRDFSPEHSNSPLELQMSVR